MSPTCHKDAATPKPCLNPWEDGKADVQRTRCILNDRRCVAKRAENKQQKKRCREKEKQREREREIQRKGRERERERERERIEKQKERERERWRQSGLLHARRA